MFQENIHQSAANDLQKQTPPFVVEILTQKSEDELLHMLKSKTPYCSFFNFLKFVEQIADKLGNIDVKKIVSESKEILYHMNKDDVMPYVEKECSQKEDFTQVVLQMLKNFKIVTCGEIDHHKELTSLILNQKNLVCFVGSDDENQTVTYLIPSVLTEEAYDSAYKVANRFSNANILSITIGGRSKIFPRMINAMWSRLSSNECMYKYK